MRCYRKIPRISHKDHVTNEEVCAKTWKVIGSHEDLLTIVKRRKLQWFGHVCRSSGLAKTILQGTVERGTRQGTQKKRWEDIRKWTGLELAKSQRAVENREKWSKLVVKSYVVSQRPSQLRDKWWWWWDYFTTSFLHYSLFSTALWDLAKYGPVHSLMLSSHLSFCLPCLFLHFTLPCNTVLARPDERETYQYNCSLWIFAMVRRSLCGPIACWILASTSSLVTWSLCEMHSVLQ